jgi:hypothetical protein
LSAVEARRWSAENHLAGHDGWAPQSSTPTRPYR